MAGMSVEGAVIKVDKDVIKCAAGIYCPTFNADTEIPVEKVLKINTPAERMIRLEIAIILPVVPSENIGAPQTDVEFVIRVPLRTRWRRHLLHLLSRIAFSPSNRCRSDCSDA